MKITVLLFTFALLAPAFAQDPESEPYTLEELLKRAIIPEVSLQDCTIQDALSQLKDAIAEQTGRTIPVRFIDRDELPAAAKATSADEALPRINLRLADAPAHEVLRYITELSKCQFLLWDEELVVFPLHKGSIVYRLGVIPVSPYESRLLKDAGVKVFKNGLMDLSSFKVTDFLGQGAKLGLESAKPTFEEWGVTSAPDAFAALVELDWSTDYFVLYDSEDNIDLIEVLVTGVDCMPWFDEGYYQSYIDHFESFEGWERVEKVLEVAEIDSEDALAWPGEVQSLAMLAGSLEELATNPDVLDVPAEEIPLRIQAIRQKMIELADRYIESLRTQQAVTDLMPRLKMPVQRLEDEEPSAELDDPFEGL